MVERYPYRCDWGCGRQNVCSAAGNSCGRANCDAMWRANALLGLDQNGTAGRAWRGVVKTVGS